VSCEGATIEPCPVRTADAAGANVVSIVSWYDELLQAVIRWRMSFALRGNHVWTARFSAGNESAREEEQRRWEEHSRRFDAEWCERKRLGVTDSMSREDGSPAIWSRCVDMGETAQVPLGIRVFGVGCHLAELIVGLRAGTDRESTPPETQRDIDQLNRDFGNLRELLQSSDSSLAEALIDPVLHRFAETLNTVATARPDLALQCESLTNNLHKLLNPPPQERTWDSQDPEVPF